MVSGVMGCGGSATQSGETDTIGVSTEDTGSTSRDEAPHDCSMQPTVVVWLALNTGGLVSADVEYSVAGGPRVEAQDCTQGACFIYEGAGQPIEVFARYQDCDESVLSTTGAICPDQSRAELGFGFYENCMVPVGTDGPSGSGSEGGDNDTDHSGTGTDTSGAGTDTSSTGGDTSTGGTTSR